MVNSFYAFVNFTSRATWHRGHLARDRAQKRLNIGFADVRGFGANMCCLEGKRRYYAAPRCQCKLVSSSGRHTRQGPAFGGTHDAAASIDSTIANGGEACGARCVRASASGEQRRPGQLMSSRRAQVSRPAPPCRDEARRLALEKFGRGTTSKRTVPCGAFQ